MGFIREVGDEDIRREKAKARELRASGWWKRRLAAGRCGYCGRPTPPRELTMDHRVPLVRGGRSTKSNLVPACKACNATKKYLLPVEWDEYLARLAESAGADEPSPARAAEKDWTSPRRRS
jgi:5-methylcytosine-specific restriction endonuclease McrA